jgi:hypothetical protein
MADKPIEPIGAPQSPPYANGYIVHKDGEVVTLLFMRIPPAFTDTQLAEQVRQEAVHAPVVSSVTLTTAGAETFVRLLGDLLARPPKEE